MENYIETNALNFSFGSLKVLNELSIEVPSGSIYGFLGPNGAGKTTTIRALLGLYKTNGDHIRLFGESINHNKISILNRIGALVESPTVYEHLSGYDNIEITRKLRNLHRNRTNEVLKTVNLLQDAKRPVRHYSLGMKQRLGLALALLSEPELLILDEPTNGLDPHGIIEIRELLLSLQKEKGTTVFTSSHILGEIEKIASHVGIINKGSLLFQGTLRELREIGVSTVSIETTEYEKGLNLLIENNFSSARLNKKNIIETDVENKEDINSIARLLVKNDIPVFGISNSKRDLEQLFLDITKVN
ncbi:MAG: ATP-binding cassette domain-containing protein [Ignavibacteriaceae bacterium]